MFNAKEAKEKYPNIPDLTLDNLEHFVNTGRPCGGFLTAVLSHDLFEAVHGSDNANQAALINLVKLIYNDAPIGCHGSKEKVQGWSELRGMEGLTRVNP